MSQETMTPLDHHRRRRRRRDDARAHPARTLHARGDRRGGPALPPGGRLDGARARAPRRRHPDPGSRDLRPDPVQDPGAHRHPGAVLHGRGGGHEHRGAHRGALAAAGHGHADDGHGQLRRGRVLQRPEHDTRDRTAPRGAGHPARDRGLRGGDAGHGPSSCSRRGCSRRRCTWTSCWGCRGRWPGGPSICGIWSRSCPRAAPGRWPGSAAGSCRWRARPCEMGGHVRVGLEDNIYLERGVLAEGSWQLVERVVEMAEEVGREISTPARAAQVLRVARQPTAKNDDISTP